MADLKVVCPECGKRLSLRGLNGHLRFEHDYDLEQAKRVAAGIQIDGQLRRLEEDVMTQLRRLADLKRDAELLQQARDDGIVGESLYERMIAQKGHELTAASRYLQRLEGNWADRIAQRTGVRPPDTTSPLADISGMAELLGPSD